MNYCNHCGSNHLQFEIPKDDHRPRYQCTHCSTIHYENPNMIVGCIATFENKILLAKRGIEPRLGYWNLPCGFLENDETVEDGAIREVLEETGLDAQIEYLSVVYSVIPSQQVYLIFKAKLKNANYILTKESTEIEFFSPDDIPWDEIAFSSNVYALKSYIKNPEMKVVHLGSYSKTS